MVNAKRSTGGPSGLRRRGSDSFGCVACTPLDGLPSRDQGSGGLGCGFGPKALAVSRCGRFTREIARCALFLRRLDYPPGLLGRQGQRLHLHAALRDPQGDVLPNLQIGSGGFLAVDVGRLLIYTLALNFAYVVPSYVRPSRHAAGAFGYFSRNAELNLKVLQSTLGSLFGSIFWAQAKETGAMSARHSMSFDVFMDLTLVQMNPRQPTMRALRHRGGAATS
jgi:hypothetical protein